MGELTTVCLCPVDFVLYPLAIVKISVENHTTKAEALFSATLPVSILDVLELKAPSLGERMTVWQC